MSSERIDRSDTMGQFFSGSRNVPASPEYENLHSSDVLLGISQTPRYGGQIFPPVNVANHSVAVAEQIERNGGCPEAQMHGLIHDAAEAYASDIPRPIKDLIRDDSGSSAYDEVEEAYLEAIREGLNVPEPDEHWKEVKTADDQVLAYEVLEMDRSESKSQAVELLSKLDTESWEKDPQTVVEEVNQTYDLARSPKESRAIFVDTYQELVEETGWEPDEDFMDEEGWLSEDELSYESTTLEERKEALDSL